MVKINSQGVFITGKPGAGKSMLALALIQHGHQLVADDVVDFDCQGDQVTGHCPPRLRGLLHSRELGLIKVNKVFGRQAWINKARLHQVIRLGEPATTDSTCYPKLIPYQICGKIWPMLNLTVTSPASLYHRLITWLAIHHEPVS